MVVPEGATYPVRVDATLDSSQVAAPPVASSPTKTGASSDPATTDSTPFSPALGPSCTAPGSDGHYPEN